MDPERAALLRAIAEHPGDYELRMVFADYLEEHGASERAEYIRLRGPCVRGVGFPAGLGTGDRLARQRQPGRVRDQPDHCRRL